MHGRKFYSNKTKKKHSCIFSKMLYQNNKTLDQLLTIPVCAQI